MTKYSKPMIIELFRANGPMSAQRLSYELGCSLSTAYRVLERVGAVSKDGTYTLPDEPQRLDNPREVLRRMRAAHAELGRAIEALETQTDNRPFKGFR